MLLTSGHLEEAAELSSRIIVNEGVVQDGVCNTWQNYAKTLPIGNTELQQVEEQITLMECD